MKKHHNILIGLTVIILFSFFLNCPAFSFGEPISIHSYVSSLPPEKEKEIDEYLIRLMKSGVVPGLSVVIVKGAKPIYLKGFGYADVKEKSPVTPKTLFELASNSKAFTALGILQLDKQGLLKLTDPIKKYLPWFTVKYGGKVLDITLEQFLHHTSGIPYRTINWIPESGADDALEKTVRKLIQVELDSYPGTKFKYVTINYDVLGLVIEKVSGQPFEAYMKEKVLASLGMEDTYLGRKDIPSADLAKGYKIGFLQALEYKAPVYRGNTPAGYFISNGEDMAKWLQVQMGTAGSGSIDSNLIAKSHEPGFVIKADQAYACGWFVNQGEKGILSHSGNNPSYSSSIGFDKTEKLGIAVLANLNSSYVNKATDVIMGILKDQDTERPVSDLNKNGDRGATLAVYILTLLLLLVIILFIAVVTQIRAQKRRYNQKGFKGLVAGGLSCLVLIGYTFMIYLAPGALLGITWGTMRVWGPVSFIVSAVELTILIYLLIAYFMVTYLFPPNRVNQTATFRR